MLKNFFQLNPGFQEWDEPEALQAHLRVSDSLQNVLYKPDNWPEDLRHVKKVKFENVSLSKTSISGMTFTDCKFEDCLFIGTKLESVEFHNCIFKNCNFYKVKIDGCYLDPRTIYFDKPYKRSAANIGVHLFQTLLDNSSKLKQSLFEMDADIRFRQWKRAQLRWDRAQGKIGVLKFATEWVRSSVYEFVCGFGYKPFRFSVATVVLFVVISLLNMVALGDALKVDGKFVGGIDFFDSVFYSFSILTSLGFSSVEPVTSVAKVISVGEALLGIGWLGLFTSILVKRFLK